MAVATPVPGVTVNDECVLVDGIPLQQCAASQQLRISCSVAMALNPKLRVLLVRDASILDEEGMALLQQMAASAPPGPGDSPEDSSYQLWIERVGRRDSEVGVVIEEGEVVAIDGKPAPKPEIVPMATNNVVAQDGRGPAPF